MGRPEGSYFIDSDVLGLRNYKYHSIDQSIIANYILNPYWWSQVIKLFPLWVAPNLITLIGFLSVVVHLVALLFFSPALETPCPDWVYLSCAIAFFFYQTMDAIDGKQARRTGTSGPLGELFDHGCDALNCGLLSILGLHTFCVPQSPFFIFSTFCTLSSFYLNTWEEYHTGTLFLSVLSGPIEGLFATIAFFLIRYAYGPDVFTMSLRKGFPDWAVQYVGGRDAVPDVPFFVIMFGIGIIVVIFNAIGSTYNVVVAARARGKSVLAPFAGVLPLLLTISGAILWLSVSPTIVTTHLVPFSLLMTLLLGYHVGLIILAHVAKRPFPYFSFPSSVVLLGIAVAASLQAWDGSVSFRAVVSGVGIQDGREPPLLSIYAASLSAAAPQWLKTAWNIWFWENQWVSDLIAPITLLNQRYSNSKAFAKTFWGQLSAAGASFSKPWWPQVVSAIQTFDWTFLGPPAARPRELSNLASLRASTILLADKPAVQVMEGIAVWGLLWISAVFYLWLAATVITEMCDIFDINCITIKKKKAASPAQAKETEAAQSENRTHADNSKPQKSKKSSQKQETKDGGIDVAQVLNSGVSRRSRSGIGMSDPSE